ncbi:pilus assembly protein [Mariniblastus sp.]|nr:pilus assembly protein [Mariniblastus sp.]
MNLSRTKIKKTRGGKCQRRGTEVVELALVLPVILLIVFSTLEICDHAFLLQKVKIAAQEGAVVAIRKTATVAEVEAAVQSYLDARGVDYGDSISGAVTVTPDPTTADTLTPVTVAVTVPNDENSRVGAQFIRYFAGESSTSTVTMFKEFKSSQP